MEWMKEFIEAVGFPIFAFCLMFIQSYYTLSKINSTLNRLTVIIETHYKPSAKDK